MDIVVSIVVFIVFIILIGLSVIGAFWWINVYNKEKNKSISSEDVGNCNIDECNAIMKVWLNMNGSDFTDSSKKFKECLGCPQRGLNKKKSQIFKEEKWFDYNNFDDAYENIKI